MPDSISQSALGAKRIIVIGSSCAGKTTFCARFAERAHVAHIELDALHWEANWREAEPAVVRARVEEALRSDSWIVDGNYTNKVQDLVWPRAELIIWLDPPLLTILKRFFARSLSRSFKSELLWGHSQETLRNSIFSRDSLLWWILSTHRKKRQQYSRLLQHPPDHAAVVRLKSSSDVADFLRRI